MNLNPEVKKKPQIWWDLWWLKIAKQYSTGSKDPSTKVGAIIVKDKRLKAAGYNNFPEGEDDNPELYWDRDYKIKHCIHAEVAAMDDYHEDDYGEATIYVYPFMPCIDCAKKIAQSGSIKSIVTTDYEPERWKQSMSEAKKFLSDNNIQLLQYPITQVT